MRSLYVFTTKELEKLKTYLQSSSTLLMPHKNKQNQYEWQAGDAAMDYYGNTVLSPKQYFFPQFEQLFAFKGRKGKVEITPNDTPAEAVTFWGIRPCDLKAMELLDKVFLTEKFTDKKYLKKREKSCFVGFYCREPYETCFCTSLPYDPWENTVYDFLFFNLTKDEYLVTLSEKGEKLLAQAGIKQNLASKQQITDMQQKTQEFEDSFNIQFTLKPDAEKLTVHNLQQFFENDDYFDEVAMKCIGCGICTYVCPTCHCFTIEDTKDKQDSGCRMRCWDCCTQPDFTQMAGGHNPRTSKGSRIRQRFLHKGFYSQEMHGEVGCVGCGRCLAKCPVSMDICAGIRHVRGEMHTKKDKVGKEE